MNRLRLILFLIALIQTGNCMFAGEQLKIGSKVKAGYSKEIFECEVISIYGNLVTLKTIDKNNSKVFHLFADKIGEGYSTAESKIPLADEKFNDDVLLDALVEGCHPNGEWYVGVVVEKYGSFLKLQMGSKEWAPVWVSSDQYNKSMLLTKEIKFMDYRHRQVGTLGKDGTLKNQNGNAIARIYSNGKIYDNNGESIAKINSDGSIEKSSKVLFKTNIQFSNGLEYLDTKNKPIYVIRVKSSSLYLPNRPDVVCVFFEDDQLKGNLRVCGGLFLLFKDKL